MLRINDIVQNDEAVSVESNHRGRDVLLAHHTRSPFVIAQLNDGWLLEQ